MLRTESFFNLTNFPHAALFGKESYVWQGLNNLKDYMHNLPYLPLYTSLLREHYPLDRILILLDNDVLAGESFSISFGDTCRGKLQVYHDGGLLPGASVLMPGCVFSGQNIAIGRGVLIESGAMIKGPAVIGDCNEVRQGAYLRGYTLSGRACVLGHTTEIKHSILLNDAKAGHFNYIGDSILGNNTNLGAGTKLANLRFLEGNVFIEHDKEYIDTGRHKFGAILGDNTQTGCNSVTNPGTIMEKDSFIMPNTTVRSGFHLRGTVIRK